MTASDGLRFSATARRAPARPAFAALVVLALAAVGVALVSQHAFAMEPCPWCVLERLIFVALAGVGILGLAWRGRLGARVAGVLGLALAAAGVAATLWQHFVAARSDSCNLTLADRIVGATTLDRLLPDVFAPRASCADAAVSLLGVPYDVWALATFVACGLLLLAALRRTR